MDLNFKVKGKIVDRILAFPFSPCPTSLFDDRMTMKGIESGLSILSTVLDMLNTTLPSDK